MAAPNITYFRDYYVLKIYINGTLHLELLTENHDGMQSWYEGSAKNKKYFIEYYRKEGEAILTGYDVKETWEAILKILDEQL